MGPLDHVSLSGNFDNNYRGQSNFHLHAMRNEAFAYLPQKRNTIVCISAVKT